MNPFLRLSLALLLFSTAAFAAEPFVGPELPVSAYETGAAIGDKLQPLVVSDGKDFVVVWADRRTGRLTVYATRIASTGEELDPKPLVLLENGLDDQWYTVMEHATAIWDGTDYVISGLRNADWKWFRARVTPAGEVSVVETMPHPQKLWPRNAQGETLEIRDDGGYTENDDVVYFVDADGQWRHFVAFRGERVLAASPLDKGEWSLVLSSGKSVRWVRLTKTGVLASKDLMTGVSQSKVKVALHGTSAAVLATSSQSVGWDSSVAREIFHRTYSWATIDSAAKVRTGVLAAEDVADRTWWRVPSESAVSVHGDTFQFAYTRGATPMELRSVRTNGAVAEEALAAGPAYLPTRTDYHPALASSATHTLLAWLQPCAVASPCHVATRLYPNHGSAADVPVRLAGASSVVAQDGPAAAATATSVAIAWRELDATLRLRASVGPALHTVTQFAPDTRELSAPAIAATRDTVVVAWVETDGAVASGKPVVGSSSVYIRRYAADGTAIDAAPVRIARDGAVSSIDVAPRGNGFEVVWLAEGVAAAQFVPAAGAPGRTWRLAPTHPTLTRFAIAATATGDGVTLVWTEAMTGATVKDIVAAKIDANGEVATPILLDRTDILADVSVAASDRELVVVTIPRGLEGGCVRADRYSFGLSRIGPTIDAVCDAFGTTPETDAVWDGSNWWIALRGETTLRAAIFDSAWNPTTVIDAASGQIGGVALTRAPGGVAAVYARRDPNADMVNRVFARVFHTNGRGRAVRH